MRAVVLSAVPRDHAAWAAAALEPSLARAGYAEQTIFDVSSMKLAYCQGEFDCWVKTPGRCRSKDAETEIVEAAHDADALLVFGPLAFGGHGSKLKLALDRLLCLLEPFFVQRHSLTHHSLRYERHLSFFTAAWTDGPSDELAKTFDDLNDANAINYLAPTRGSVLLDARKPDAWAAAIQTMLSSPRTPGATISGRAALREALLAAAAPSALAAPSPRRAALLIGSPKAKGTSASETLARSLQTRLERLGVASELHFVHELVHDDDAARKKARAIAAAELFVLVSPLYVDAFPSLTTHALELVAEARAKGPALHASFATIVNSGFPEPEHIRTALRIARHFADEAGYVWGGGLPIGGGGVVTSQSKLDEPHGPIAHIVRALDAMAPALATTAKLPREAIDGVTAHGIPESMYRVMGDLGWRYQAWKNGVPQAALHARPFE